MPENITTVPNLPEAGDPSLSDLLYLVQGEGSDRDRKVTLERLRDFVQSVFGKITCTGLTVAKGGTLALTVHDSQAGDITLEVKPYSTPQDKTYRVSLRGSLSALRFAQKCLFEAGAEVSGGIKADTIEGTNQGQGSTKYLVLGNTTVNGDLDVKGKAMLGSSMLVADPDEQTLESTVPLDFGNGYKAGKELVRTDEVKTAKISAPGTTITITAVLDAIGVKGNVTTDSIAPETAGQPISVTGGFSISGNVTLTGASAAVSGKSVTTEKLACSKLSLKDNGMAYAPAFPYFVDTAFAYDGDLSRYCAGAPSGGRVTFVNATGSDRKYTFTGGANGKSGYFTLKNGRAVDLLVFNTNTSTQATLVPIGIDFSTGD